MSQASSSAPRTNFGHIKVSSIMFDDDNAVSASSLTEYETGTFNASASSTVTGPVLTPYAAVKFDRIGDLVTLHFPVIAAAATGGVAGTITASIPAAHGHLFPIGEVLGVIALTNNDATAAGTVKITAAGAITIGVGSFPTIGNFTVGGPDAGVNNFSISYTAAL